MIHKIMSAVGVANVKYSAGDNSVRTLNLCEDEVSCKKRIPKRVIHFSDGTLEEYSSDDESDSSTKQQQGQLLQANAAHLRWMPWFWYQAVFVGSKALAVCDYLGETLANFFGITSPKYEYEIEHYKRILAEEEERRRQDAELGNWSSSNTSNQVPVLTEPLST